ncbi:MAG: tetratricopeptide repeat protein [Desulfobacterales bacterium]|nr:tetratricopeptide repeat protein [Desulfobacterales bacterium]
MGNYRNSRKIVKNTKKRLLKYSGEYIDIVDVNNSREVRILKKFGKKKTAHEKLDSVNILKKKIVDRFNSGKKDQGFRLLNYLIENQKNNCLLLSKSLCDLSKKIKDNEVLIYILDYACNLKYPDRIAVCSYGNALAEAGRYDEACEKFERCIELFGEDVNVLGSYGKALADNGRFDEAYKMFERYIELFGEDEIVLNSYGKALADNGRFDEAYEKFERCTELFGESEIGLSSYGRALADNGRFDDAYEKFERCTELFGENEIGLNSYGKALADNGRFEEAYEKFEQSIRLFGEKEIVLTSYGKALADNGRFDEAYEKFESALSLSKDDQITLFLYAIALEKGGNFSEAALKIEAIIKNLNGKSDIRESTFFYFTLGRLYYYNKQTTLGDKYLQLAINNAAKRDKALLQTANIILSTDPFSRKASEMLQEITESSKQYVQALRILSISLRLEEYFYQFSDTELVSEMKSKHDLYRHIIHKIGNQVSLLRFLLEEIIRDNEENSNITALQNIKEKIYNVFELIQDEKDNKAEPESNIDKNDYRKIISEISKLSHDITNKIGNALYLIKHSIPLLDTPDDESLKNDMNIFMKQLDTTIITLNTLKSINEGIKLNPKYFKINELFANLKHGMKIRNAVISLDLENKNDTFYGDKNKIREIISELIENSVKHNENNENLTISVKAALTKDPAIHSTNYKGMFLSIVTEDNGKGIPAEKKNWVFLPLNTTSQKGTGLGLFINKRLVEQMKGFIWENGYKGTQFRIFIPCMEET